MNVSGLLNASFLAELGAQLNEVGNLSPFFNDEELCVGDGDTQPMIAFKPTHLVTGNMKVVVGKCMDVTVGAPINKSETMIAGETLDHLAFFFHFSLDDFIVVAKGPQQILNESSLIETDTVLKLCHNVSVSGILNQTWIVEHGTRLGEISELSGFWNNSFTLFNTTSTNQVYTKETLVTSDTVMTIIKSTRVVIDITPTDEVNTSEVIKSISEIVGGDPTIVTVDVVWNEEGQVTGIIIIVEDESTATTIVGIINDLDTGTGCVSGVLCRKTNAYVDGENLSDAHISFASTSLLLSFILINHFM